MWDLGFRVLGIRVVVPGLANSSLTLRAGE